MTIKQAAAPWSAGDQPWGALTLSKPLPLASFSWVASTYVALRSDSEPDWWWSEAYQALCESTSIGTVPLLTREARAWLIADLRDELAAADASINDAEGSYDDEWCDDPEVSGEWLNRMRELLELLGAGAE